MKLDYKLYRKLLPFLGILCALAFGLRIYTYWKELDVANGFFAGNGAGCVVFNVLSFAVFFLCLLFTYRKSGTSVGSSTVSVSRTARNEEEDEDSLLINDSDPLDEVEEEFPTFFLHGFAKKCAVWFGTFSALAALLPGFGLLSHGISFLLEKDSAKDPYTTVYMLLTIASGIFFLFYALRNSSEKSLPTAIFSLVPAFAFAMRLITEYRDMEQFLNKAMYVGQFLFVIAALSFFLNQSQILLGEDNFGSPNAYVFSGVAVVFFGLAARLPQLFAIMGSRIQMNLYTSTALLADLALTLFVASKLMTVTKRK